MSTAAQLGGAFEPDPSPSPLGSALVAAGQRITSTNVKRVGVSKAESWQDDAWDMYDLVGEQRFLSNTLANRMGQARFYVGKLPENTTEDIETQVSGPAYDVFQSMVGRGANFSQMISRMGLNLFIAGDGYLLGCPKDGGQLTDPEDTEDWITPLGGDTSFEGIDLEDLDWRMLSVSECNVNSQSGEITAASSTGPNKEKFNADDVALIRVWKPHPRRWWQADSPTRSSLPVLRELVGLTMHISAQVDSRLAGAGVFFIPQSADTAMRRMVGMEDDGSVSPFASELMDAMLQPISDRGSASALVPLMPVVPDESIEKFRWVSFAGTLDAEARALRDEAIRRLALGEDCPPELLLGVAGMNHWGAWLVREDVVTTHLEPPLALICDAITTQFLWPVLEQQGIKDYQNYVVWYDVDHLIQRPNRAQDAKDAKASGLISDSAARDALGFDESDAPGIPNTDPITDYILDLVDRSPQLLQNPGLDVVQRQVTALLEGGDIPPNPEVGGAVAVDSRTTTTTQDQPGEIPATEDDPAPEDGTNG